MLTGPIRPPTTALKWSCWTHTYKQHAHTLTHTHTWQPLLYCRAANQQEWLSTNPIQRHPTVTTQSAGPSPHRAPPPRLQILPFHFNHRGLPEWHGWQNTGGLLKRKQQKYNRLARRRRGGQPWASIGKHRGLTDSGHPQLIPPGWMVVHTWKWHIPQHA